MILYESSSEPIVRVGEFDLGGRRVAARCFPYGAAASWNFDPIERRFLLASLAGSVPVGPHDPEAWREALARTPAGPVAVGPCDPAEEIRGAYRAAAQGAAKAGRGVFLLDSSPWGLPEDASDAFVALFVALPGVSPPEGLTEAIRRGLQAGVVLPLVPGWTREASALGEVMEMAIHSGAQFFAPLLAADDGASRRAIVEVRGQLESGSPEDFFEQVHHGDWRGKTEEGSLRLREMCAARGLACLIPRPVGEFEPSANAAAAGRLEERADALFSLDEHRAALLHAAVRWIDESARDLAPIVAEGNFRKIFPFAEEIAREAEAALQETP